MVTPYEQGRTRDSMFNAKHTYINVVIRSTGCVETERGCLYDIVYLYVMIFVWQMI